MRIAKSQLMRVILEASKREALDHPISALAHKQQRTFAHGTLVDPEGFTRLIQQGIDFTNGKAPSPLQISENRLRKIIRAVLENFYL